jgi:hypothetical protein
VRPPSAARWKQSAFPSARAVQKVPGNCKHEKRHTDMQRIRENVEWRTSQEFQAEANRKRVESNARTNSAKKENRN